MKLDFKTYMNKMRGCFLGKNIGGTLGGPLECYSDVTDVDYYLHDISKGVLPNDDLDLQLVFLVAAEQYGARVNGEILGNYWQAYIVPDWSEYGYGKRNMRAGLYPSVSGGYRNTHRDSNGSWIRSEIWACLAPGHPEIAVRYAYEDSIVDHGKEGVYAELFCAAMESAAFVESDMEKLINLGLSYIPKDCLIAQAVAYVRECAKDPTLDWKAARLKILQKFPSSFDYKGALPGHEIDPAVPRTIEGVDAPANIALTLLGHYFGGGDFSKAICISAGCCEDADCTAGTLAAIYGIINGPESIDEKWLIPIGDEIKTISVDMTKPGIAKTVTELTDRIARLMPSFIRNYISFDEDGALSIDGWYCHAPSVEVAYKTTVPYSTALRADKICTVGDAAFLAAKLCFDTVEIREGEELPMELILNGKAGMQRSDWWTVVWHLPEEWEAVGGREAMVTLESPWREASFRTGVIPHNLTKARYDVVLELRLVDGPSRIFLPLTLMRCL